MDDCTLGGREFYNFNLDKSVQICVQLKTPFHLCVL